MADMLVKLYMLPDLAPVILGQTEQGIIVRRGLAPEKHFVLSWIKRHFSDYWVSEADIAFSRNPVSCFIAVEAGRIIGFAVYDVTRRGFFGPTGVAEAARGRGTGKALLLICLHDMHLQGYGYAIIGGVGPAEFYTRVVGASLIEGSEPGVYAGLLRPGADGAGLSEA